MLLVACTVPTQTPNDQRTYQSACDWQLLSAIVTCMQYNTLTILGQQNPKIAQPHCKSNRKDTFSRDNTGCILTVSAPVRQSTFTYGCHKPVTGKMDRTDKPC